MRRRAALVALVCLLGPPAASADASPTDTGNSRTRGGGWVPAFAVSAAFHGHFQKSAAESQCDFGGSGGELGILATCTQSGPNGRDGPPTLSSTPTPLRDAADGSDLAVWPSMGIDLQLMSPRILELPYDLGPRVFVSAEIAATFPPERSIANEGNLTQLRPPKEFAGDFSNFPSLAFAGGGSETNSQPKTFSYGAQVGLAFPLEFLDRRVRIKPSFGWIQYQIKVSGRVLTALKDDVNGITAANNAGESKFGVKVREIDLSASETRSVNAIGPGIEVELDSGQFGSISAAVFASAHAYKVLGKRKINLADQVTFADDYDDKGTTTLFDDEGLREDTYRARWKHEIDPWLYRFRLGIRFHYLGK